MRALAFPFPPAPRVRGRVRVPPGPDPAALTDHVLAALRARECRAHPDGPGRLVLDTGMPGRHAPLAFVDGGTLWLAHEPGGPVLRYDLSTAEGLRLCLVLSLVCAAAAGLFLGSLPLTLFGLLAPVLWLYGANYVIACVRVPAFLGRLCRMAPSS